MVVLCVDGCFPTIIFLSYLVLIYFYRVLIIVILVWLCATSLVRWAATQMCQISK